VTAGAESGGMRDSVRVVLSGLTARSQLKLNGCTGQLRGEGAADAYGAVEWTVFVEGHGNFVLKQARLALERLEEQEQGAGGSGDGDGAGHVGGGSAGSGGGEAARQQAHRRARRARRKAFHRLISGTRHRRLGAAGDGDGTFCGITVHPAAAFVAAAEAAAKASLERMRAVDGLPGGAWKCSRCGARNGVEGAGEAAAEGAEEEAEEAEEKAEAEAEAKEDDQVRGRGTLAAAAADAAAGAAAEASVASHIQARLQAASSPEARLRWKRCIQGVMHAPAAHLCAACGELRPKEPRVPPHRRPHLMPEARLQKTKAKAKAKAKAGHTHDHRHRHHRHHHHRHGHGEHCHQGGPSTLLPLPPPQPPVAPAAMPKAAPARGMPHRAGGESEESNVGARGWLAALLPLLDTSSPASSTLLPSSGAAAAPPARAPEYLNLSADGPAKPHAERSGRYPRAPAPALPWGVSAARGAAADTAAAKQLGAALARNTTVTGLDLRGCSVGDAGATALAEGLRAHPVLTEVGGSGNRLVVSGITLTLQ
jgi:hypothetical protein